MRLMWRMLPDVGLWSGTGNRPIMKTRSSKGLSIRPGRNLMLYVVSFIERGFVTGSITGIVQAIISVRVGILLVCTVMGYLVGPALVILHLLERRLIVNALILILFILCIGVNFVRNIKFIQRFPIRKL